jgi:hypothetical protein
MPVSDEFPVRLRNNIENSFEQDLDAVFDLGATRLAVEARARSLRTEVQQVRRLRLSGVHGHGCGLMECIRW